MDETTVHDEGKQRGRNLAELSATVWLTPENAVFTMRNGFLYLMFEERNERVFLYRQFPFELQWEWISVMDHDQHEIGIVRDVHAFDAETAARLVRELSRRYYSPVIQRILSVKERYGFSHWKVHTAEGTVSFTLHDTYRSIVRAGDTRLILLDVNGNRFEIADTTALDRKSYKKIELYL